MENDKREEQEAEELKKEEQKLKPEEAGKTCECDEQPAESGEGKKADDAATEKLDKKARKTSNDSRSLAGPNTKPTERRTPPEDEK